MTAEYFLDKLDNINEGSSAVDVGFAAVTGAFVQALLGAADNQRAAPDLFRDASWLALVEAVQADSYYLSCDELLVIAEGARQNIVVCKRAAGESSFQIEGYVLENVNETVVVYVQSNNTTRVRSHFERLALTIVSADSGPSGSEGARGSSAEGDAELGASGFSVDNSGASERGENKVPASASEACANEMGLRGLEQGAVEETHETTKERRWKKQQEISTHFEKQGKEILRAPGLSFVEGILWQLGVVEDAFVWEVVLNVLHHIATTPKS